MVSFIWGSKASQLTEESEVSKPQLPLELKIFQSPEESEVFRVRIIWE